MQQTSDSTLTSAVYQTELPSQTFKMLHQ